MEKLVLIDGNSILHRAFHAIPPLTTSNGRLVNAIYGFFSMLLRIVEETTPTHLVIFFDRPKPTFRKELFVGYQAKRPKMSDDLSSQIGLLHEILAKIGVLIYEVDGYEADDLIGTIAKQGSEGKLDGKMEIIIVSSDRDMLQLVNHNVKVLAIITGITKMILFDEKKVEEKYGLKTTQFVDYKAMVGDASDNYPGVTGIGPKTASDLLKNYESLENIYHDLSKLPPKIAEKLATDAEQAALAKKLAAIVTDAPITLDTEKCSMKLFDMDKVKEVFEELGFKSLLKRVSSKKENIKKTKDENGNQLALLDIK